jgi:osmotically-inducible protein OsmY
MSRINLIAAVCTLALAPCLGGCAAAVVGGMAAAGGVGYEAAQERGINGAYDDTKIKFDLATSLGNQYGDVTATIYWGRVLLTGSSPTQEQKMQAEQVASQEPGVRVVYNEIVVGPPESAWEITQDGVISTRVRSDLVLDADVRSGNYTVQTDHQSVYLIGSARSQAELDRATELARYVPGVQRVVSYVEIRHGEPGGYQPPPPQASAAPLPSGGMAPPPPNTPIQVQKLP